MASNLVNVNLCYIEIELCIAQLGTQVRRLGTQVHGNILAVSISGAALPYSAVWRPPKVIVIQKEISFYCGNAGNDILTFAHIPLYDKHVHLHEIDKGSFYLFIVLLSSTSNHSEKLKCFKCSS